MTEHYVVSKQMPVGKLYVECRVAHATQWTNDIERALVLNSKRAADQHIGSYDLFGASATPVDVTDRSVPQELVIQEVVEWGGMHEVYRSSEAITLYVPRSKRGRGTGNYCVNDEALKFASELADKEELNLRILLGENRDERTYREINEAHVSRLSLKQGPHGPYRLVKFKD
jgi:hypothetical protein